MIVQDVLNMIPSSWSPADYTKTTYIAVPLNNPYSAEFIDIRARLEGSYFNDLTGLFRVQNPLLWAKFLLKKHEYEKQGTIQLHTLFHDTAYSNIDSICNFNFDWRMGQRFKFGPGVYFSTHPDNACKHSSRNNGPLRAMFIVDVLTQNIQFGDKNIFLPDPGYDTVVAHGCKTYVKYFDCEYYPRYFATYEHTTVLPVVSYDVPKLIIITKLGKIRQYGQRITYIIC